MIQSHAKVYKINPAFPLDSLARPWFIQFGSITSVDGFWFDEGKRIPNWKDNQVRGTCPPGLDLSCDFMLAENGWQLFSSRAKDVIESEFKDSIQFLPILYGPEGEQNRRIYIGQVLHLVDGIDKVNTRVDNGDWTPRANGTFRTQHPIVLKREVVSSCPVFHVVGNPWPIYVNDDFRRRVEEGALSGFRFEEVRLT